MCQMTSEALLRGSSLASCSSKAFHETLTASDYPTCSSLSSRGLSRYPRLVSRMSSSQKPFCSQAVAPLPKLELQSRIDSCEAEQRSSFPDRWMEDCVCDIVKNINEAPFLHMLFDSKDRSSRVKSQRQRVVDGNNLSIDEKWREVKDSVRKASPDGVILVRHLDDEAMEGCCLRDGLSSGDKACSDDRKCNKSCASTNLWGVLVLGRDVAKSACYILKTTSVISSLGTCTQFCLTKAKCFGPSWHNQVQSCWLLSADNNDEVSK